jgi:hypothetical protein
MGARVKIEQWSRNKDKTEIEAFWDVEPCGLVEVDRRFRGMY